MRSIKKRIALWHIVLIVGIAAIAIPVTAHVSSSAKALVNDPQVNLVSQNSDDNSSVAAKIGTTSKVAKNSRITTLEPGSPGHRQDYYDRRRQYWEDRMDRRIEEEDMDDDDGEDKEDSKDKKDSKSDKDDEDDSADKEDKERDVYEQRREYWRQRLEREW